MSEGVWRVDVEMPRRPGTPRRRRSRTVRGTRGEAEQVLADLRSGHGVETKTFGVRLSMDLADTLQQLADLEGVPVAEEIRRAISERVERQRR